MPTGWMRLYRQLLDGDIWDNHALTRFWIWCLLKATYSPLDLPVGYASVHLEPGQFVYGRNRAAEETGLSVRTCRTALVSLLRRGCLKSTQQSTKQFTILTIVNWDHYQSSPGENDQPNDQAATRVRPSNDQGPTTNKKIKKINKKKKEDKQPCAANKPQHPAGFTAFWEAWPKHPRKVGKAKCLDIWTRKGLEEQAERVVRAVEEAKASDQWTKEAAQFIPMPQTWLNQARYDYDPGDTLFEQPERLSIEERLKQAEEQINGRVTGRDTG